MTARSISACTAPAASAQGDIGATGGGLSFPLRGEIEQRAGVGGGDLRMVFVKPADAHADRLDPLINR